jgi:hypothetical protein
MDKAARVPVRRFQFQIAVPIAVQIAARVGSAIRAPAVQVRVHASANLATGGYCVVTAPSPNTAQYSRPATHGKAGDGRVYTSVVVLTEKTLGGCAKSVELGTLADVELQARS